MCIYSETLPGYQRYQVVEQPINQRFETLSVLAA